MCESMICETTWKQFLSWLMCICLPLDWGAMQEKLTLSWPCPSFAHTTHCFLVLTQLLGMWTVSKRPAGGCGLTVVFYGGTSTLGKLQISRTSSSRKLLVLKHNYLWNLCCCSLKRMKLLTVAMTTRWKNKVFHHRIHLRWTLWVVMIWFLH